MASRWILVSGVEPRLTSHPGSSRGPYLVHSLC